MLKILTFFCTRTGSLFHTRWPSLFVITPYPAVVAMCVTTEVEPNFFTEEDLIYNVISVQIKETLILKSLIGTFAKLRKATFRFIMSVRLSALNNSAPMGRSLLKFGICGFFENLSRKFQVWLKYFKYNGYFTGIFLYLCYNISLNSS